MKEIVVYIHGKGGNAGEANNYKGIFPNCDVVGLDYHACTPWDAKKELPQLVNDVIKGYDSVILIANSIGAFFAMNTLQNIVIERAFFISPIVNMERLIIDMMQWANVSEEELKSKKVIQTSFGETLSWEYLCYVRNNRIDWNIKTDILYGEKDNLTPYDVVKDFAKKHNASLTVMINGEHWFHTKEQMEFLNKWLKSYI